MLREREGEGERKRRLYKCDLFCRKAKDGMWYLCKWRDLGYDQATWEKEDNNISDMKMHIENYENLRYLTFVIHPIPRVADSTPNMKNLLNDF